MLNCFFRIDAVFIVERDYTLESTRAVQSICCCNPFCALLVFICSGMFSSVPAMRTFIYTRVRRILSLAPEESLRLNLLIAFFACSEIQGLKMPSESFLAFFDCS